MKPPTIFELKELAGNHRCVAEFHRYQLKHSKLSESEKETERELERKETLIALACERWQFDLEAKRPGA